ncbi:maleylpyruvate isomerase family mycothiol-dependent enzyme [Nocardioides currus]|nr:maleylpyruvate isomerase family mycothiol-dependent enzyme [Nocardioides currus]
MGEAPDWLALLAIHTERFGDIVRDAEVDAPVPSCPGWSLRDLVVHLGGVHQWAAHAVLDGNPHLRPEPPAGTGRHELTTWYRRHASHLVEVLTSTAADAPAWTLDDRHPTAAFWRRRQVHETVMHVWDADHALGQRRPIDPPLAWDGVLEVRDVIYPRQVRLGRVQPLARSVHLVATDVSGDAVLGDGEVVVLQGGAEVLLRLLWHRADLGVHVSDPHARTLLSGAITP